MRRTTAFAATLLLMTEVLGQSGARLASHAPEPPLSAAAQERLDQCQDGAESPFRVRTTADGRVRVLVGGLARGREIDRDLAARSFVTRHAALLGVDPTWTPVLDRPGSGDRAHFSFARDGLRIDGASVVLVQNGVDVTGVAIGTPPATATLGAFELSDGIAAGLARAALESIRRDRGLPPTVGFVTPQSERRWLATTDGLLPVVAVEESTPNHAEAYLLYIDARDGRLAAVRELVDHGTGFYPDFGNLVPFPTTKGEGRVFKSVSDARNGVAKKVSLPEVSKGVPNILNKGFAVSAHADTWDNNQQDPFATNLKFNFDPFGAYPEFDNFDHANVLYQAESFYKHVDKAIGQDLATDFALPFLLNISDPNPNAFFSATTFPVGNMHIVGWMGFFETQGFEPFGDLSRDPTVVDHEYTHAWLAFEQLSFSSNLDEPPRAVNEAVADFFAVTHHKDTVIGRYADDVFPSLGIARDLQGAHHFPETTTFFMQPSESQTGLPEEHGNGLIFGGLLVDIRNELGSKKAEKRLFQALPFMPRDMDDIAFGPVNAGNAVDATEAFMVACVAGLLDVVANPKESGVILGAATGRGLIGGATTSQIADVDLEQQKKRKFVFPSGVHLAGTTQSFRFQADQGRKLKVTVVGEKGSSLQPAFTVVAVSGTPGAVTEKTSFTTKKSGRIATQQFKLNDPDGSSYVINVFPVGAGTGAYALTLDA